MRQITRNAVTALAILFLITFIPRITPGAGTVSQAGDFAYEIEDGGATIIRYTGHVAELEIPNMLGDVPVTAMGEQVFDYCHFLTNVTIPASVTSIGKFAFDDCSALKSVSLPDNLTAIGDSAFSFCWALDGVVLRMTLSP